MALVPFVNLKVHAIIIGLLLGIHKDATEGELRCKEFFYLRQPGLVPKTSDSGPSNPSIRRDRFSMAYKTPDPVGFWAKKRCIVPRRT
jgi:hypothetical protein